MTDVIIFSGQSNMEGQTEKLLDSSVVPHAYEYKYATDALVPLCDPFGENLLYDGTAGVAYEDYMGMTWHEKHALGGSAYGNTSLIPEFCRVYTKETGREVTAVGAAKGAETIDYFMPAGKGYDIIVKKAKAAINKTKDFSGDVYIVWLQGESDAIISKDAETYFREIIQLAHALKSDLGISRFGVIRVGRFTNDERDDEIIKAQDRACETDGLFLMLTDEATRLNEMPEYMNPYVGGHFSAMGLSKLGHDAALTLSEYVKRKNTNDI